MRIRCPSPFYRRVHANLVRLFAGRTLRGVARRSGLPERQVHRYLRGEFPEKGPHALTLRNGEQLARGLGCSLGDLLAR